MRQAPFAPAVHAVGPLSGAQSPSRRNRAKRFCAFPHAAPRNTALTLSGVNGTERRRAPVASNTAFETAADTTAADGSPAPQGFSAGRSIRSMTMSGTSGKVRIG